MAIVLTLVFASIAFGIVLTLFETRKAVRWSNTRHMRALPPRQRLRSTDSPHSD